jgi:tetratricopeptide (TPR) repeat protein
LDRCFFSLFYHLKNDNIYLYLSSAEPFFFVEPHSGNWIFCYSTHRLLSNYRLSGRPHLFFALFFFAWQAHNNLAQLLHRTRRFDEAERHYRAAVAIWPAYPLALFNLATLLHTTGAASGAAPTPFQGSAQEEALCLYRLSIDATPRMPEVRRNLGEKRKNTGPACVTPSCPKAKPRALS